MEQTKVRELQDVVIRFSGDSGDGMQLTGTLFSDTSALLGNGISTFPDYPAEIRAPQGTVAGVSGFQVHFGDHRELNPGDYCDVLVAMNPAALKANRKWLKQGATVIIDGDSITEEHLKKAGFATLDPIAELGLDEYNVVIPDITSMTREALKQTGLDNKAVVKCKNMFALGICFYLFDRPEAYAYKYLETKFARKNPVVAEANKLAIDAGYNYAANTHQFANTYTVSPAPLEKGTYRTINGNVATAWGLCAAAEKAGLPLELKFLPVIESALQPTATSPSGAVGLWQFMLNTGRQYGLEISSMIDQRRDPVASTRAACAYLKDLYKIYGDWTLAIASYNYGPGNVNKALKRAGSNATTYWDIYPYLPTATRDYIPAFVGLTYAYHYYKDHHIQPYTPSLPLATDTVTIKHNLHLEQVAATLGIPMELLQALNPQYKQDIIPAAVRTYPLVLPQREISRFLEQEQAIYDKDSIYLADHLSTAGKSKQPVPAVAQTTSYKVRKGDTLGAIAAKHGVTAAQLMKWNGLKSANRLQIGQTLKITRP
mgnify:CR=1 FL=1